MPTFCYGLVIFGALVIAFTVHALTMIGCRTCLLRLSPPRHASSDHGEDKKGHVTGYLKAYLVSAIKYNMENAEPASAAECVVCLTGFEDGEYAAQLPNCRHSFRSPCIHTWLYFHSHCPICRAAIDPVDSHDGTLTAEENITIVDPLVDMTGGTQNGASTTGANMEVTIERSVSS